MRKTHQYRTWDSLKYMLRLSWQMNRFVLVSCLLLALIEVGLKLIQLYIAPEILQQVENGRSLGSLFSTILFFGVSQMVCMGMKAYITDNQSAWLIQLRMIINNQMTQKSLTTAYPHTKDPEVKKQKEEALYAIQMNASSTEHIWTTLTALLANGFSCVFYLYLLARVNLLLSVVVMMTTIIYFVVAHHFNQWEYKHRKQKNQALNELSYISNQAQSLTLAKDLRVFGMQDWMMTIFKRSLKNYERFVTKRETRQFLAGMVEVLMSLLRNGFAYAYLIYETLTQNWSASTFLLYFGAVSGFSQWMSAFMNQLVVLHQEGLSITYILEYLNMEEPFLFEEGKEIPKAEAYELRLKDVSFSYPGTDKKIIDHLNLTIHAGERVAIVGLNGAGKTTLIRLLCGFYDPDEGSVLLNGQDIRQFDRRAYYDLFSAVFQEYPLINVTVEEMISQRCENINEKRVWDCLDQAGMKETIAGYPQGLKTHIGRDVFLDGVLFSGGETQRLILARALYKNGSILVLDEPTSALDPLAENDIYQKYHEMTQGKTAIFISHRLASTSFCDRILYFSHGKITESGTHASLLEKGGQYAHLFEIQSRYYQEGGDWHDYENIDEASL